MREITALFHYLPDIPDKAEIERRINECGLTLKYSELRAPDYNSTEIPNLQEWHQEGSVIEQCVMWASSQPTEFRLISNHAAIRVYPGCAVLIDNQRIEHRMPVGASGRWFYKGIVQVL